MAILIVDDDPVQRRLLENMLQKFDYEAVAVDNGDGCATQALLNSDLFIVRAANALNLLLEPKGCKATLRF